MNDCDDESGDDDGGTAWDVKAWEWSDLDWRSCDDSGTAWDAGQTIAALHGIPGMLPVLVTMRNGGAGRLTAVWWHDLCTHSFSLCQAFASCMKFYLHEMLGLLHACFVALHSFQSDATALH